MNQALIGLGIFAATISNAHAEKFANQFVQFEAPPQWQCVLEGAEWVCQSANEAKKRDAIIILAAKLRGEQDSFDQYTTYLKKPKNFTSVQGKPVTSEVKFANSVEINGQTWIDSLHLNSEMPGFYTRYLATVKEDIGVLVTYSINQSKYEEYTSVFETLTKTLRVFRKPGSITSNPDGGNLFALPKYPAMDPGTVFQGPGTEGGSDRPNQKSPTNGGGDDSMIYVLVGIAIVGFIIYRRRMNKD